MLLGRGSESGVAPARIWEVAEVLLAAFLALTVSSLTYSALHGEPEVAGRMASEEIVAGLGIVAAAMLLFYSIVLTMEAVASGRKRDARARDAASFMRRVLVHALIPLVLFFFGLGIEDYLTVRHGHAVAGHGIVRPYSTLDTMVYVTTALGVALSFPIFSLASKRPLRFAPRIAAIGGLAISVTSAIGYGVLSAALDRCEPAARFLPGTALALNALAMLGLMWLVAAPHRDDLMSDARGGR